ncbi:hypothetical protein ACFS07_32620 [Undibacterium arcticum]
MAIALIAIVMGAIAYMSRSSASGVGDQGAKNQRIGNFEAGCGLQGRV